MDINRNTRHSGGRRRRRVPAPTVAAACWLWEVVIAGTARPAMSKHQNTQHKEYSVYRCVGPGQSGREEPWGTGMAPLVHEDWGGSWPGLSMLKECDLNEQGVLGTPRRPRHGTCLRKSALQPSL